MDLPVSHKDLKVAVVAHLYYDDLAADLIRYLENIPAAFDLYLSTRPGSEKGLRAFFSTRFGPGRVVVKGVENRGFDIRPFLIEFGSFYPQYDFICKVHGKKSARHKDLEGWGRFLLENLLGSPEIVAYILRSFQAEKNLGLLFPDYFPPMRHMVEWGSNWEIASRLGEKLNLKLEKEAGLDFPAGSMFWFRPGALKSLLSLKLRDEDFEKGSENLVDGTLAHALERLFLPVVEEEGYIWKKVSYAQRAGLNSGDL
ncbi:MAG: hypothetical protein JRJ51_18050 [Deltaproteobacteria bacterium]|nr:hypothetical protein [Deltaproteobacteria bacterium]